MRTDGMVQGGEGSAERAPGALLSHDAQAQGLQEEAPGNSEPAPRDPALWVQGVQGMLQQLSKQVALPEGTLLSGEVLRIFSGGRGAHLRDLGRATIEVRLEQPLKAERGDLVEVPGVAELVSEAAPLGLRVVWRGSAAKNRGPSPRFRARRTFVEERAARLSFETPRISARLRSGGRVRVVSTRHSKAWDHLQEAARQFRWLKVDARYCEELGDPASVGAALEALLSVVGHRDVVLVTCGAGELAELDVFEEQRVVAALASLTERCPTILAVSHAADELMTNKVVTYPSETPAAAVQLIVRESGQRIGDEQSGQSAPEGDHESAEEVGGAALAALPTGRGPRSSIPPAAPKPSARRQPGALMRLLFLAAAVCLGWWARGL